MSAQHVPRGNTFNLLWEKTSRKCDLLSRSLFWAVYLWWKDDLDLSDPTPPATNPMMNVRQAASWTALKHHLRMYFRLPRGIPVPVRSRLPVYVLSKVLSGLVETAHFMYFDRLETNITHVYQSFQVHVSNNALFVYLLRNFQFIFHNETPWSLCHDKVWQACWSRDSIHYSSMISGRLHQINCR